MNYAQYGRCGFPHVDRILYFGGSLRLSAALFSVGAEIVRSGKFQSVAVTVIPVFTIMAPHDHHGIHGWKQLNLAEALDRGPPVSVTGLQGDPLQNLYRRSSVNQLSFIRHCQHP